MQILLTIFFLIFTLSDCFAQENDIVSNWDKSDEVSTRIIAASYDKKLTIGVELNLKENWHTYWRNPGDGGLTMSIVTDGSTNVANHKIIWPAPKLFIQKFEGFDPIETYGYKDKVIFPIIINVLDDSKPVQLNLKVNYAVCEETCIFKKSNFNIDVTPSYFSQNLSDEVRSYIDKAPQNNGDNDIKINSVEYLSSAKEYLKIAAIRENDIFTNPEIFIEAGDDFRMPKGEVNISDDKKHVQFIVKIQRLIDDIDLNKLNITLVSGDKSVELKSVSPKISSNSNYQHTPPTPINSVENQSADNMIENIADNSNLALLMLFAFIGGLILNIMPCVLPVLSLKIMGVMSHGGAKKSVIRSSFLMSSAGIIFSFIILALIVISLKSAGNAVGWGFHFQEPLFLIFLVIILNMFAANQWELFHINMPSWLGGTVNKLDNSSNANSPMGNFITGGFATLLATPCSAPFLGTAISFALSQGTYQILIIFLTMGLGLAFPYLLLAFFPALISRLPKAGQWMVTVKHILGILLLLTSVWLLWVISNQLGLIPAIVIAALSIASIALLWMYKKHNIPTSKTALIYVIIIGLAVTFYIPTKLANIDKNIVQQENIDAGIWHKFDEAKIQQYIAQNKVVFVDITADWCITCKVNKWNVLSDSKIIKALGGDNVVAMRGDISSPDPTITAYMKRNNKYAIPFNIVYGKNAVDGIVLSEILTKDAVLSAIENAR